MTIPHLKVDLRSQLDLSRRAGDAVADPSKDRRSQNRRRIVERNRIRHVGGVGANLQVRMFLDADSLQHRHIDVEVRRCPEEVARRVAQTARPRNRELRPLRIVEEPDQA